MTIPLLPVAAAGAGILALLALSGKKGATPAAQPGTAPGTAPASPAGAPVMPPQLKAQFDDLLTNAVNADGLDQVAGELEKFGFVREATLLRARAAQLRANAPQKASSFPLPPSAPPIPTAPPLFPVPLPSGGSFPIPGIPGVSPALNIPIPVIPPPPPAPAPIPAAPVLTIQRARVTTNDAAPAGDLIMRTAPSDSASQVPGGGADKDGIVVVLNPNASSDGVWAEIQWDGGRRPAARGFAKKRFLVDLPPAPAVSGLVIGAVGQRFARCVAPSGCRLRVAPNTTSTFRALVANGETVQVLQHAQGGKADLNSPGPGGWAHVKYKHLEGWVPSEWLSAAV